MATNRKFGSSESSRRASYARGGKDTNFNPTNESGTGSKRQQYQSMEGFKDQDTGRPKLSDVGGAYHDYVRPKMSDVGGAYHNTKK